MSVVLVLRVGVNNGTPLTEAQITSFARLLAHFRQKYGMKIEDGVDVFQHREIAIMSEKDRRLGRKHDQEGATTKRILERLREINPDDLPRTGDWWVKTSAARVRQGPGTIFPTAGIVPYGTKIDVSDWNTTGEPVSGDPLWAHWATQWGFTSHTVLSDVPVGTLRAFLAATEDRLQSALFARIPSVGRRVLPVVDCGGYGSDESMLLTPAEVQTARAVSAAVYKEQRRLQVAG